jgi:hypothetical protein
VRDLAIRRARARIVAAGTSVMDAAHSGDFGWSSTAPVRYSANRSKPTVYFARNSLSYSCSVYSTWASPSMSAVSVFGRIAIRSVLRYWSVSVSRGLIDTTGVRFARSCASHPSSR